MLVGPTGGGKTMFAMAMSWSMAAGKPFLHWDGSGRPRRLLYIDSEMPPTLMAARAEDATRRLGEEPAGMFVLPKMLVEFPPLNTRAGQAYMDKIIAVLEPKRAALTAWANYLAKIVEGSGPPEEEATP
jgi:RecA-family ATPase